MLARKVGVLLLLGVLIATLLGACARQDAGAAVKPAKRTLYIAAIEPKGSTTVDKEPFPSTALPKGGGYLLKAPDQDGKWEASTYRWLPGTLVVNQGDEVTLEIMGINGKEHPSVIEGYDVKFNVLRGQLTRVTFKADKAGVFNISCGGHAPAMTGQLIVLPRA